MINFPSSPTNGQIYIYEDTTYVYNNPPGVWSILDQELQQDFIGTVTISSSVPTDTKEGMLWYDNINNILFLYTNNGWFQIVYNAPDSGSNVDHFVELKDVPSTFSGQASKVLTVNSGETGLEFTTNFGGVNTFLDLTDSPASFTSQQSKFVAVNGSATGLEFVDAPAGGGGVTTFVGLTDTPLNFSGQGNKLVAVNSGASALEFIDAPSGDFVGLTDTPANFSGQANKFIAVNSGATALEFVDAPGGSGSTTFVGLIDTPADFSGQGSKLVAVNSGATALEFIDAPAGDFVGLTDTPADFSGQGNKLVAVNSGATALEFIDSPAGDFVGLTDTPADFSGQGSKFVAVNVAEDALEFVDAPAGGGGGETNTASNENGAGVGVFIQKTGVNLEFKGINAASNKISVSDVGGNNTIALDIVEANLDVSNSDNITEGASNLFLTTIERTQIGNTETTTQLNTRDTNNRDRANHTGTQLMATISDAGNLATLNSVDTAQVVDDAITVAKILDSDLSGDAGVLVTGDLSTQNSLVKVDANGNLIETGVTIGSNDDVLGLRPPIDTIAGTSYTLLIGDCGKIITFTSGSAITLNIPTGLGVGFNCTIIQKGTGQITFTPSGTTVNHPLGHTKSYGQHATVGLVSDVADNFYLSGDTNA